MAVVIQPVVPRRYNANPRGSATKHVTLAAHNPFEQRTRLVNRSGLQNQIAGFGGLQPSGALPGMGYLASHLGDSGDTTVSTDPSLDSLFPDSTEDVTTTPMVMAPVDPTAAQAAAQATDQTAFNQAFAASDAQATGMPTAAAAPAAPGTPFNWNALTTGLISAGGTATSAILKSRNAPKPSVTAKLAAVASSSPLLLVGGLVLAGGLVIMMMSKKKK